MTFDEWFKKSGWQSNTERWVDSALLECWNAAQAERRDYDAAIADANSNKASLLVAHTIAMEIRKERKRE